MSSQKFPQTFTSVNSVKRLYESNWERMSGLQMVDQVAQAGYELIKSLPTGRCLDIGCGDGSNAKHISRLGFTVEGIEISPAAVKKAKANGIPAQVLDLNDSKLPFSDNTFSLVWMSDVIEHVFWPESVMTEIYRVLKKGGSLFISTPNFSWIGNRILLFLGQTPRDLHPEHIHWFNSKSFTQLVTANGFSIEKIGGYNRTLPFVVSQALPFVSLMNQVNFSSPSLFTHTLFCLAKK